jgi:hypothetical protein
MTQAATLAALASSGALSADSSGNVGIGVTNPGNKLSLPNGSYIGWKNNAGSGENAGIRVNSSDAIEFYNVAERARIDSSGNLLVNMTSSVAGKLQVKNSDGNYGTGISLVESGTNNYWATLIFTGTQDLYFGYNGTNKGYFSSSTGAYTASSDRNLKKYIEEIKYGLAEVLRLKPSTFLMQQDDDNSSKHLGFIAQDVQEVLPESVSEMKGGLLGLETTAIIPVLVKAIQEQQAMIEELKAKVAALEAE